MVEKEKNLKVKKNGKSIVFLLVLTMAIIGVISLVLKYPWIFSLILIGTVMVFAIKNGAFDRKKKGVHKHVNIQKKRHSKKSSAHLTLIEGGKGKKK